MKKTLFSLIFSFIFSFNIFPVDQSSVYTQKPEDPEAFYFSTENYGFKDGEDVTVALQSAINQLKREKNFGILFVPEGKYRISNTVYIPNAIRVIGYGKNRPEFILTKSSPGFQEEVPNDKGKSKYMFWFTGSIVEENQRPRDAGAGTFYSAMSNINIRIEDGNPHAVALRTHYAQHSFVSHMSIYIGKGKAGIFDIGNEMENLAFYGGDYGIYTTKASPGWPVMMVDSYFEGQRKAALHCQESGLAFVNLQVKNVPTVIEIESNYADRLMLENCRFENVNGPAFIISNENNSNNQISLRNVDCIKVPLLAYYRRSGEYTKVDHSKYKIKEYDHGLQMTSMVAEPEYQTLYNIEPIDIVSDVVNKEIPRLPEMSKWVNIRDLGAIGDGEIDDTKVFQDAIDNYDYIYVPQGCYIISETLKMRDNTCLIGLHPMGTQLKLKESTPAFSGFGGPIALLESSKGGLNILNGIGINTGGINYRAVGLKWMANADSYVNDVKFVGGHGTMRKPVVTQRPPQGTDFSGRPTVSSPDSPIYQSGKDMAWDNQYWSLWVNEGGGTFKDIWTASTYSANGVYVSNTSVPGKIYAMSVEHHVRNEATFKNISNWKIYCLQTEEESVESTECQPIELINCKNVVFANLYMFRVIRVNEPYHSSVRVWDCENIKMLNVHNYAQTKFTNNVTIYDINKNIDVRPWELQKIIITGNEPSNRQSVSVGDEAIELASGFDFVEGITSDSKGNVYFSENRMRRIYKWSADTKSLTLLVDFPWKPINLAVDSEDNLLVSFRYDAQPGHKIDGVPESEFIKELPDRTGTSFSGWGNSGFAVRFYSINPDNPEETIELLPLVDMGSIENVHKALYVSNKWRDFHDFNNVTVLVPEKCFVAPDKKTIIPQLYDLARSSSLLEAFPGKPFYTSDEYDRRIVKMDVAANGILSNLTYFVEWGEFGLTIDDNGDVYVADGHILVFDNKGDIKRIIKVPERPSTIKFGGKDNKELFITGRSKFFKVDVNL